MYDSNCLSGVVRLSPEEEMWRDRQWEFSQFWRNLEARKIVVRLGEDGKLDREWLDRHWGRPIDVIREEEEWEAHQKKLVEEWEGPTAQDIILDCLTLLKTVREENRAQLRSHKYPIVDPEKRKKLYLETVNKRMAMKFTCPYEISRKMICQAKVIDKYWCEVKIPMTQMLEAAHILFDGDKFIVDGKEILIEDFIP